MLVTVWSMTLSASFASSEWSVLMRMVTTEGDPAARTSSEP
jgi:hypothetical protein